MALNVVLYQPEIPPNTGTIARSCAITGTKLHLIKPLGFSIDDKAVKRAGLDYWHLVNLEVHESLEDFLAKYPNDKMFFASTKAHKFYHQVEFTDECFIIFGKETKGLPSLVHDNYKDQLIKIPMIQNEAARSLNLSNSANIILFEALRQLDFDGLI